VAKPTRRAVELQALLIERIESVPELRGKLTDAHVGGVVWMEPIEGSANWTVRIVTERALHRGDIARFIRELQLKYDLEE
jgi:hypothetical protein